MTLQDKLLLIYTIASAVQTVVIAVTGIFVFLQTRAARRSVDNLEETARLNIYLQHRRDTDAINRLLIEDPELRELLGYDKPEMLAFVLIGHAETMFRQKNDSTVSDVVWHSQLQLIKKIFRMDFVVKLWTSIQSEYTPDFVTFVEKLLAGESSIGVRHG